jgi:hypothetical protein
MEKTKTINRTSDFLRLFILPAHLFHHVKGNQGHLMGEVVPPKIYTILGNIGLIFQEYEL